MPICPECGETIELPRISPTKHAISHYGVAPREIHTLTNPIAQERYKALLQMEKGRR